MARWPTPLSQGTESKQSTRFIANIVVCVCRCVWKGCAYVQKQKCKFGALQHLKLYKKHQVPLKRNLHFAKPLQRAAHPMERCPVYFLNHANTGQPHSCAPKLGGFRLPCGIPVSAEVEGNREERRRQAWPVNGKHLSHCGPLTPPCYAFSSFRSHDSGKAAPSEMLK